MAGDTDIKQGQDITLQVAVYSDEAESVIRDLTGYSVLAYRIGLFAQCITKLELTGSANTNGSVVQIASPPTDGLVNITLKAADTAALSAGEWDHELWVTDNSSNDGPAMVGTIEVKKALASLA